MQLRDYLEKYSHKPTPWALENNLSPATISRLLNKAGKLTMANAVKIRNATSGEVSIEDLCEYIENA